jgi:hypothetical protein
MRIQKIRFAFQTSIRLHARHVRRRSWRSIKALVQRQVVQSLESGYKLHETQSSINRPSLCCSRLSPISFLPEELIPWLNSAADFEFSTEENSSTNSTAIIAWGRSRKNIVTWKRNFRSLVFHRLIFISEDLQIFFLPWLLHVLTKSWCPVGHWFSSMSKLLCM